MVRTQQIEETGLNKIEDHAKTSTRNLNICYLVYFTSLSNLLLAYIKDANNVSTPRMPDLALLGVI